METPQHPADLAILIAPLPTRFLRQITEIDAVAQPQLRLVATADRGQQVPPIFRRRRRTLLGEALDEVGTDRFGGPAELVRQGKLFDPRQLQADPVNLERYPISAPEDLKIFDPSYRALGHRNLLAPDSWFLTPDTRSFGAWLEPRYIFGAGQLD